MKVASRVGLGCPHIRRKAEELNESSETLGWWSGTSVDTPVQWGHLCTWLLPLKGPLPDSLGTMGLSL